VTEADGVGPARLERLYSGLVARSSVDTRIPREGVCLDGALLKRGMFFSRADRRGPV